MAAEKEKCVSSIDQKYQIQIQIQKTANQFNFIVFDI